MFQMELSKYEYKKAIRDKLKTAMHNGLKRKLTEKADQSISLKKRITELKNQLAVLEEKYISDKIDSTLYEKYRRKYQKNIDDLTLEMKNDGIDSSNLE